MKARATLCADCNMESIWLSWSRLRTHTECKQKAFLQRTGKKAEIDNHRNFLPGNITDRVVRDWLLDDPWNNLSVMPDMVSEYLTKAVKETEEQKGIIKWKSKTDKDEVIQACIEAVTNIEPSLKELVLPYEYTPDYAFRSTLQLDVRGREEPVQVVLNGYMDILVQYEDSGFGIFDVKHTRDEYYYKKTVGQLNFYDTAIRLAEGQYSTRSGLLQPLCREQEKHFEIRNQDRVKMWQSIQEYAQDYVNLNVTPSPSDSTCYNCNVKHACTIFKPKMRDGRKVLSL